MTRLPYRKHTRGLIRLIQSQVPDCRAGVEVGVWRGYTSMGLLREFPRLRLYAVDPWMSAAPNPTMPKSVEELMEAEIEYVSITQFASERRNTLRMESIEAALVLGDIQVDFVFIDGNHLYECVKADLAAWWPKVRPGGLFCGHDYIIHRDKRKVFGVQRAVDEWAVDNKRKIEVAPGNIWWCLK